jgi:hypothetical protein
MPGNIIATVPAIQARTKSKKTPKFKEENKIDISAIGSADETIPLFMPIPNIEFIKQYVTLQAMAVATISATATREPTESGLKKLSWAFVCEGEVESIISRNFTSESIVISSITLI